MNTLEVGKAITSLLEGVQAFGLLAPRGTTGAFLVYQLTGLQPASSKDRYNFRERAMVDITTVASSYRESVELAQRVREKLEPFEGEVGGLDIGDISLMSACASTAEGNLYLHILTYQITLI